MKDIEGWVRFPPPPPRTVIPLSPGHGEFPEMGDP